MRNKRSYRTAASLGTLLQELEARLMLTTYGPLFTFTSWNQDGTIKPGNPTTFNQYVPLDPTTDLRSETGCVATAVAQVANYYQFPKSITFNSSDAYVSNANTPAAINIDGDSAVDAFPNFSTLNSDLSSLTYTGNPNEEALLSFATGIKAQADYGSDETGAFVVTNLFTKLGYQSVALSPDWAAIKPTVISNIEAGQPVVLGIFDAVGDGHCVILEGYNSTTDQFYTDFGWGGLNDGWFSPPSFPAPGFDFNTITQVLYNISPTLAAPTGLTASQGTYLDHVHLTWNPASEATGYTIWRSTTNDSTTATQIASPGAVTSYDDASAAPGQTYFYWVKSSTGTGTLGSDFSNAATGAREIVAPNTPTNSSPANNVRGVALTATLTGSTFVDSDGEKQGAAEWVITRVSDGTVVFDSGTDSTDLTTAPIPASDLTTSTQYSWQVRYQNKSGLWSNYSTATSFTTMSAPNAPVNASPTNGTNAVALSPVLSASTFSNADNVRQAAAEWVITRVSDGIVVYDSGTDTNHLTATLVPTGKLANSTQYSWQVRYENTGGLWSAFSALTTFTTRTAPGTPVNLSPLNQASGVSVIPTLAGSAFLDTDGEGQAAAEWVVKRVSDGMIVYDSGTDTLHLVTLAIPAAKLAIGTAYSWQVRYENTGALWSSFSTATTFTTTVAPNTPVNISPASAATAVSQNLTLSASAFSSSDSETQVAAEWVVTRLADGSVAFDSGANTTHLTSDTITLASDTSYSWSVRYENSGGLWSNYSTATTFTVQPKLTLHDVAVSTASAAVGDVAGISVSFIITNAGAAAPATTTRLRLSVSSSATSAADPVLVDFATPALPANSSLTQTVTVVIPTGTAPGTYYVWATADNGSLLNAADIAVKAAHSPALSVILPLTASQKNSMFVNHLYEDVLHRAADPAGLNYWVGQLNAGAVQTSDVANALLNGTEYRTTVIQSLYQSILGRAADANGLAFWLSYFSAGHTIEDMKVGFYGSAEYFQAHGGTNAQLVQALYLALLNRAPDPTGLAYWTGLLNQGADPVATARQIMTSSQEGATDIVNNAYTTYLHRGPDAPGLAYWVGQIQQGASEVTIIQGFLGSAEYYALAVALS